MELYVGMDVSLKQTSICVVDGSGEIVSEGTVNSEPSAIAEFIKAKAGRGIADTGEHLASSSAAAHAGQAAPRPGGGRQCRPPCR